MTDAVASALRLEIEDLYAEHADCLAEGDLERWPELFTTDCLYRITSRENHERGLPLALVLCESRDGLRDRVMAIRKTAVFRARQMRYLTSGMRLLGVADDGALACRTSFAVFETLLGEETRVFATGCSLDRVARDGDGNRLRFRERVCVLDSSLVPGSLVYPL
jgi:3-phenylpropionate/cinnamic acid dioxygenase small subunit